MPLTRLNAVRTIIVLLMAIGYASTMSPLSGDKEVLRHLGYDPSWFGLQILFCLSGYLAVRSLTRHGSSLRYLTSRVLRTGPLLVAYTLAAITVIYPIFCTSTAPLAEEAVKLTRYFILTVLLLLALAISATLIYGSVGYFAAKNEWEAAFPAFAALRLSYAFLGGAALYGWQDKLPQSGITKLTMLVGLLSLAAFQHAYMHWTPAIEIAGTFFWTYLSIVIIQTPMRATAWMNHWPNIVLGLYLGNWPVSQTLILMHPELHGWALIGMSVMITTVIAILAHAAISGHINRWAATALRREVAI